MKFPVTTISRFRVAVVGLLGLFAGSFLFSAFNEVDHRRSFLLAMDMILIMGILILVGWHVDKKRAIERAKFIAQLTPEQLQIQHATMEKLCDLFKHWREEDPSIIGMRMTITPGKDNFDVEASAIRKASQS